MKQPGIVVQAFRLYAALDADCNFAAQRRNLTGLPSSNSKRQPAECPHRSSS